MATRTTDLFTFSDLFAGIGGFRIAFESVGGDCVFSAEWDRFAQQTYEAFFGERPDFSHILATDPPGDLTQLPPHLVPDHDILTAGFPCQPFSLAGVSKKKSLGMPHGFDDPTQGTLFFTLKEIIAEKEPRAFLLENVKNLLRHDQGRTFEVIMRTLCDELGYQVKYKIIDAAGWVPQHRERVLIVGFHPSCGVDAEQFRFPDPPRRRVTLEGILEDDVDRKYTLKRNTWDTLKRHKKHHAEAGNGFGYSLMRRPFDEQSVTRTISARYHKDGAEALLAQGRGRRPRRLTPLECMRLMGFRGDYERFFDPRFPLSPQPVSDTQAYRQAGNSVVVPLATDVAKTLVGFLASRGCLTSESLLPAMTS